MGLQQKSARRESAGGSEHRGGTTGGSAGLSARLLYVNAVILVILIAGSFALPLSGDGHWAVSIGGAFLLGLDLAMVDESHRRARRYAECGLGDDERGDATDYFVDF